MLEDARDAEIVNLATQWRAKLNGKIAAALPVWASDHWTLLLLERKDPTSDEWIVEYKDSLSTPSEPCKKTAKKLLEILSAATGKILNLPERSNKCMQAKMSGTCGFFVAHWIDAKMREIYHKEPQMSTGTPIISIMKKRLLSMVTLAERCLQWAQTQEEKMEAQMVRDERERKEAADMEKAIKESLDMQEMVQKRTRLMINHETWDAMWGCPKCKGAKRGSTCCNPHKISAKMEAEKIYAAQHGKEPEDGKYDTAVYNALYDKIRDRILAEHAGESLDFWTLPQGPKKDQPASGSKDAPPEPSSGSKDEPGDEGKDEACLPTMSAGSSKD